MQINQQVSMISKYMKIKVKLLVIKKYLDK